MVARVGEGGTEGEDKDVGVEGVGGGMVGGSWLAM